MRLGMFLSPERLSIYLLRQVHFILQRGVLAPVFWGLQVGEKKSEVLLPKLICIANILYSKHAAQRTRQGTNISPQNGILKMIFLFPRWDMLIPWRVHIGKSEIYGL